MYLTYHGHPLCKALRAGVSPDFEVPQVNREAKIKIPDCDVGYKLKVGVDKQVI